MKNIVIMGTGRAGKTTLSNMLKDKYNQYSLIHSDAIKWGLIRGKGKESYYRTHIEEQKEFEHSEFFQRALLEIFNSLIRGDKHNYGYILESGQLSPKIVHELIDFNNTIVVCLGLGDYTVDDIINLCRKHDTPEDWSYGLEEEKLRSHAKQWIKSNEEFKKDCSNYGIPYFDTTKDRVKILTEVLEIISLKNENTLE